MRIALTFLLFFMASCGYQFRGSGTSLPDDIKTVAVLPVENLTTQPGLDSQLAGALKLEFDRYGAVTVVESADNADAVLFARVLSVETSVRNVTSGTDVAVASDLTMTIFAELKRSGGQLLYRNDKLSASSTFADVSDVVVTSSSRFASGDISGSSLAGLESRELSRGQQERALNDVTEEISRKLYLDSVAAEF